MSKAYQNNTEATGWPVQLLSCWLLLCCRCTAFRRAKQSQWSGKTRMTNHAACITANPADQALILQGMAELSHIHQGGAHKRSLHIVSLSSVSTAQFRMLITDLHRLEQLSHGEVVLLADVAQFLGQVAFQPGQQGRQLLLCRLDALHILLLLLHKPDAHTRLTYTQPKQGEHSHTATCMLYLRAGVHRPTYNHRHNCTDNTTLTVQTGKTHIRQLRRQESDLMLPGLSLGGCSCLSAYTMLARACGVLYGCCRHRSSVCSIAAVLLVSRPSTSLFSCCRSS